jgi:hypothetical protein
MSEAFARQKHLAPRYIDPEQFAESIQPLMDDAVARAARKRNILRGHRSPAGRHITQRDFC